MGGRDGEAAEAELTHLVFLPLKVGDVSLTLTFLPHDKYLVEKEILRFLVFGGKNFHYGGRGRLPIGLPSFFLFFIEEERQSEAVSRKASKNGHLRSPRVDFEKRGRLANDPKRNRESPQLRWVGVYW